MLSKPDRGKGEKGFTLIELIMVLVILGILAGVAIPKYVSLADQARTSAAKGVGGAISSTIAAMHADYLLNANDYSASDVVNNTLFESGVANPVVAGNVISWVSGASTYAWTYTPRSGVDSAYLTEDSSSAFP